MKTVSEYIRIIANIKSQSEVEPTAASGNIYIGISTTQLMLWGVVYDFMSFCTTLYGTNSEDDGYPVSYSRIKLSTEIAQYDDNDFQFEDLRDVFLSIAGCANRYVPSMIFNRNGENSEEDHEIDNTSSTNSSISDNRAETKSNNQDAEPPQQKRTCNRMSVFSQHK